MASVPRKPVALLLSLAIAMVFTACDRRAEGESGDMSPDTGITTPTAETPTTDPDSGTASAPATTTVMPGATTMTAPPSASTIPPATPPAAAGAPLNDADKTFLGDARRSNETEIATTELGMQRGGTAAKDLSAMLNADHVALRDQVATMWPDAPAAPAGKAPAGLEGMRDTAFDARLLAVLREQHEGAISAFTDASNDADLSEPVRTLAKDTLPKLQAHLKSVRDAQSAK
jgi:predicted outer membrane protein